MSSASSGIGMHGWASYALVGLAVAYFASRHNQPLALRSALYPLVTNLGIGSLQVSSGLETCPACSTATPTC